MNDDPGLSPSDLRLPSPRTCALILLAAALGIAIALFSGAFA